MISAESLKSKLYRKDFWEPFILPAIVILVGISAFALGRLSAIAGQEPIGSVIIGQ